jgi:hypothetical protein
VSDCQLFIYKTFLFCVSVEDKHTEPVLLCELKVFSSLWLLVSVSTVTLSIIIFHHYLESITNRWQCRISINIIVSPPSRHDYSQCLFIAQFMWLKNDTKNSRNPCAKFDCTITRGEYHGQWRFTREDKFIWGPTESTRGETFQHWPFKGKQKRCRMCSLNKKTRSTPLYRKKCDVGLYVVNCFEKWHTHARQSVSTEWSERSYHNM